MDSNSSSIQFFTSFQSSDFFYILDAAFNTLLISCVSIILGTILGIFFGWVLHVSKWKGAATLGLFLDIFRSIPLIIQIILFYNFFPLIGIYLDAFEAGTVVLTIYCSSLMAFVLRGGLDSVETVTRRAARSLGMTYFQDLRYIVFPIGLRAILPSWTGVALGVLKDSALVSVIGYVELLRASQILITRTQQPFLILTVVGLFYFSLSYPIARFSDHIEKKWQND